MIFGILCLFFVHLLLCPNLILYVFSGRGGGTANKRALLRGGEG